MFPRFDSARGSLSRAIVFERDRDYSLIKNSPRFALPPCRLNYERNTTSNPSHRSFYDREKHWGSEMKTIRRSLCKLQQGYARWPLSERIMQLSHRVRPSFAFFLSCDNVLSTQQGYIRVCSHCSSFCFLCVYSQGHWKKSSSIFWIS